MADQTTVSQDEEQPLEHSEIALVPRVLSADPVAQFLVFSITVYQDPIPSVLLVVPKENFISAG